jgi:hypothetical protein
MKKYSILLLVVVFALTACAAAAMELPESKFYLQLHRLADDSIVYSLSLRSDHEVGEFKDMAPGAYFWHEDGEWIGFLPDAGGVWLSRDDFGHNRLQLWRSDDDGDHVTVFYDFPSLKEIGRIKNAGLALWLADGRVAYTLYDFERVRPDSSRKGWSSVVTSFLDGTERVVAAQATATEDYTLVRLDVKNGKSFLFIQKESVDNEREWANEDPNSSNDPVKTEFLEIAAQ